MTFDQPDYIVDVGYTRGYYAELNPLRARLAMLKAGLAPPEMSTACELGFGQGVSLAIHAAASSTVWYGNDINPEHVASASALIAASGATAHLFEESFTEFAQRADLPDFDYIGMNGVWSWISDASQAAIVDFVQKRLKTGGVFYINYIALPGWAPYMPVRELLAQHAESAATRTLPLFDRIDASLEFARQLQKAAPAFFADNPAVADYLSTMGDRGHSYLAHAYFNQNYRPTYFSTVASLFTPAGLHYVGPADIGNLESVHLTRPQRDLLGTIGDPVFRELVYDFLVNRYARRDLWVKGDAPRLDKLKRASLLRETKISAAVPRPELPVKLRAALTLNGGPSDAICKPLLQMLSTLEPASLGVIEKSLASRGATLEQLLEAVLLVAGQEQLEIVQPQEASSSVRARCEKLNGHLLEAARSTGGFNHFASPVTGAGVALSRRQQLFLLAHREGADRPEALAAFVRTFLADDTALIDHARTFIDTDLPLLKRLEVA